MDILNIKGLTVDPVRTIETNHHLIIGIERRPITEQVCLHCFSTQFVPNGTRSVRYADLPIRGKPVILEWHRQRYRCQNCGKSSSDNHSAFHDEFMMTTRLYEWVATRCMTHTFSSVALDVGLDERSVRRVFEHWSDIRLKELEIETPRIMGIDEVHLLNAARGILTNIGKRTLVDLLPNRDYDTMARRISKMPDRERVKVLAMDMWSPYRSLAENLLPNATVVIDKWHVTKYADLGMETIRKSHRAELSDAMRRQLLHDRFLLLSRAHKLTPAQTMIMETWTHQFPDLAAAHVAKESFYDIYDCPDRRSAEVALDRWLSSLTPEMKTAFKKLLSALKNWRELILNYFDVRITNAYTEALNGLIKISNRNGRGYSFKVLRARTMLNREAARQQRLKQTPQDQDMEKFAYFTTVARYELPQTPKHYGADISTIARLWEDDLF
ncbi:ISL3 family transposase [Salmonella enterica]|nr:ISL3 family transposase [Salmonella enterica]ECO9835731.1 ISL3 family transposase [Salmonella enterica]